MTLHLVAVLVDAAKVVAATVEVQDDAMTRIAGFLSLIGMGAHLNPLGLERLLGPTPLPPQAAPDQRAALLTKLPVYQFGGPRQMFLWYPDVLKLHPLRRRHPLAGKGLQILDGMASRMLKERSDQTQPLVVGEVRGRLLPERFPVEILPSSDS